MKVLKNIKSHSFSFLIYGSLPLQAKVSYFDLKQIRLLLSPFKQAEGKNLDHLLVMDPKRLLVPFLNETRLPNKTNTENCENTRFAGIADRYNLPALP